MINLIKSHLNNVVTQDYLIKYNTKTSKLLPKLDKVVLSIKFNHLSKGAVVSLLEIVGTFKPYLTKSKVNSVSLNLRKGDLAGAKLVLRKKFAFDFLQTFSYEILPYSRNNVITYNKGKLLHYQIKDIFVLDSTTTIFDYLRNVKTLDISVTIKNTKFNGFPLQL